MAKLEVTQCGCSFLKVNIPLIEVVNKMYGSKSNFVSYAEEQDKTDEEKARARRNIGLEDGDFGGLSKDIVASIKVGGIGEGANLAEGTTFTDFVDMLVNPYQAPACSIEVVFYDSDGASVGSVAERNTNVVRARITATVTKKTAAVTFVDLYLNSGKIHTFTEGVASGTRSFMYEYTKATAFAPTEKLKAIAVDENNKSGSSGSAAVSYVDYIYVKPKTTAVETAPASSDDIRGIEMKKAYSASVSVEQTVLQYGVWVCCPSGYKPAILTSSNDDLSFTDTNVEYVYQNGATTTYKVWYSESAVYNSSYYEKITFTTV